jgi:hydroxyquinol 1,2-dioxygenase
VSGSVTGLDGNPIAGAVVDVWHSDQEGYYDVQHAEPDSEFAMRARFRTAENGEFCFWTIKPAPYPIPHDGPVGLMLKAQGRHPWRPAHVHFMIEAPGYHGLVTHAFASGDQYLDSDVVFGVKESLIRPFRACSPGEAPDGRRVDRSYFHLHYDFHLSGATRAISRPS